ncbi:hypothetical protein O181_115635 [Austropuccinia psidii MF-1]|uniref:Uncharacterized protein n=1 Tax=Austropuccinia psidii MF-1 TaxID=1389203 RepID=A0A9Q3KAU8_9BASI|nr:hypothetical protein [Austropuccinia psidii MF-1]
MALHLNPEAIAAIYAQMGISGHFPQNQGKWPKWLFLAIWAHNAHLRTLTQSVQKTLSRPLGQFLAQNPKVAKNPKGPRNTFPSSEAITAIFFPSVFPSQDLWINSMVAISNGHFNIPTYHHVIKAPNHSEDSSRLKSKCFSIKDQSRHQDVIG